MSLYSQWQELINAHTSEAELRRFWDGYFKAETEAYKKILSAHKAEYAGREEELAQFFGMPAEIFIGFIDGINTSLRSELPLEEIEKDTEIKLDIDFEKLYFNMHEAKADWLYNLREWGRRAFFGTPPRDNKTVARIQTVQKHRKENRSE